MLTESCQVFFAVPCCLSAILRDEYLTSVVRTPSLVLWAIYQNSENKPRGCRGLYFSKALFEGLIFGGAYLRREIWVQHRLGYPYKWKEIYRFCLVLLCIWGQFPSISPPGGLYLEGRFNGGFFALRVWGAYTNLRNLTVMETRRYVSLHFSVRAVELNVNAEE